MSPTDFTCSSDVPGPPSMMDAFAVWLALMPAALTAALAALPRRAEVRLLCVKCGWPRLLWVICGGPMLAILPILPRWPANTAICAGASCAPSFVRMTNKSMSPSGFCSAAGFGLAFGFGFGFGRATVLTCWRLGSDP